MDLMKFDQLNTLSTTETTKNDRQKEENMHTMAVPEYTCWQQLIVKI